MHRPEARDVAIWTVGIGGLIIYDVWATGHRPQGTLTCLLKWLTHSETPQGRVIVETAVAGLTRWAIPHLCELTVEVAHSMTETEETT